MVLVLILGLLLLAAAVVMLLRSTALSRGKAGGTLDQIGSYGFTGGLSSAEAGEGRSFGELASSIGKRLRVRGLAMGEAEARTLLVSAGMYGTSADRLLGYQVLSAFGVGALLLWLGGIGGFSTGSLILFTIFGVVLGWFLPLTYVKRRLRLRREQIEYELPDLIDLLVVSIEAGLSFPGAMRMASDRLKGPLGQELRLTLQEQNMGLSTAEALTNLGQRADTQGVNMMVRSIVQGEALGVSMGQIMRNIAEEMRKRRKAAAEERAQKAPIKLLFPIGLLIFPSLFVVILLPAIITIARELNG